MAEQARAAAADLDADRIEVLPGDIGDRRLGLDDADLRAPARGGHQRVYHLAAIYDLAVPLELAQRVNVEGTGNVLDLCARCDALRAAQLRQHRLRGGRRAPAWSTSTSCRSGQGFKNHYESTKFQAEVWVRAADGRVPTTIYRPAIVVGDSRTGETQKFDGPYYMLRTIARGERTTARRSPSSAAPRRRSTSCRWTSSSTRSPPRPSTRAPRARRCTSWTPSRSPPPSWSSCSRQEYAGREPRYRVPPRLIETSLRVKRVREAFGGAPRESILYLNHPVRFDTRRADELLARHGLRCPRFEEYVGPIVEFFREHETDPALVPAH